jgi:hypothetical protein
MVEAKSGVGGVRRRWSVVAVTSQGAVGACHLMGQQINRSDVKVRIVRLRQHR